MTVMHIRKTRVASARCNFYEHDRRSGLLAASVQRELAVAIGRAVQLRGRNHCAVDARLRVAHQRRHIDFIECGRNGHIGAGGEQRVAVCRAGGEGTVLECGGDAVLVDPASVYRRTSRHGWHGAGAWGWRGGNA